MNEDPQIEFLKSLLKSEDELKIIRILTELDNSNDWIEEYLADD